MAIATEIQSGNLLSDGVTYHASDINAAINGATVLAGVISDKAVSNIASSDTVLALSGATGNLFGGSISSLQTLILANPVTTGTMNVQNLISLSGALPVNPVGTQNDYNPTNFDKATIVYITSNTCTFTGFQAEPNGTLKLIVNGGLGTTTISREDVGSIDVNRFNWGGATSSIALSSAQCALLMYVNVRWLVVSTNRTL